MKKLLTLAAIVAISFGCSKKTSEEPKPVVAATADSKIQLRLAEDASTTSATATSSTSSEGSLLVKLNFRPGIITPAVTYNPYTLIPVVTYPTYADIGGESSGLSGNCYASLTGLANDAFAAVSKVATSAASGNADFSSYCQLISDLRAAASSCPEAASLNTSADALCTTLKSLNGLPGITGTSCSSCN